MIAVFFESLWDMLRSSGPWLIISFTICGLLRGVLRPEVMQKSLGNKKFSSVVKATVSGALLPICSCGVTPISLGLYRSGAHLGPTLAFLIAAPIINPAAVILAYALLGPQIATIYVISGFVLPMIVGVVANRFGGKLVESPHTPPPESAATYAVRPPLPQRLASGLRWGYMDLAVQACRFIVMGLVFAALLLTLVPAQFIQQYLANPQVLSIASVALLGSLMYVCAVGHIPFIAALLGIGAAPGVALTFLLVGVSTNLPEMVSIWKLIGRRAVFIYTGIVVVYGFLAGYAVNLFLGGEFMPQFDMSRAARGVEIAGHLTLSFPEAVKVVCAAVIATVGLYSWLMYLNRRLRGRRA